MLYHVDPCAAAAPKFYVMRRAAAKFFVCTTIIIYSSTNELHLLTYIGEMWDFYGGNLNPEYGSNSATFHHQ